MNMRLADLKVGHIVTLLLVAGLVTCGVIWSLHTIGQGHRNQRAADCTLTYIAPAALKACQQGILSPDRNP